MPNQKNQRNQGSDRKPKGNDEKQSRDLLNDDAEPGRSGRGSQQNTGNSERSGTDTDRSLGKSGSESGRDSGRSSEGRSDSERGSERSR